MNIKKILKKIGSFIKSIGIKGIIVIALVFILSIGAIGIKKVFFTDSKSTKLGFENIGELATQSAYVTTVDVADKTVDLFGITIPFTQTKYIYSYDTIIKAGFDFKNIVWSVSENNKEIKVTIPKAKVLSIEVKEDSLKIYHEQNGIFTRIRLKENNIAFKNMKKRAQKDAIANGLLKNAQENAKPVIQGFIGKLYNLKEYKIKYITK